MSQSSSKGLLVKWVLTFEATVARTGRGREVVGILVDDVLGFDSKFDESCS